MWLFSFMVELLWVVLVCPFRWRIADLVKNVQILGILGVELTDITYMCFR